MDRRSKRSCIKIERLESRTLFSSSYNVVDLGVGVYRNPYTDLDAQVLASLNNRGEVLINGTTMSSSSVYQNGQLTPMSTYAPNLVKHRKALPLFIDDAGDIIGTFYAGHFARAQAGPHSYAKVKVPITDVFLFDGKHFKDIGIGTPQAVAGSGVVVGTTDAFIPGMGGYGSNKAFLYFHGRRKIVPAYGSAFSVNANGDFLLNDGKHIYKAATHTITTFSQDGSIAGVLINDSDEVVGQDSTGNWFLVSSTGQSTPLGALGLVSSAVAAINDSGIIVGPSNTSSDSPPFLVAYGSIEDLNSLAPPSETGWTLT